MTIDEANTAYAVASSLRARLIALQELIKAAAAEAYRLRVALGDEDGDDVPY